MAEALLPFGGSARTQGGSIGQQVLRGATEAQQQQQHGAASDAAGGTQPHAQQAVQQLPQQHQQQPDTLPTAAAMADERQWYAKLSQAGCSRTEQLRVCSHRGRLSVEGLAPPGSLSAYSVLYKAGVSCYDVDFMLTSDGQLLATHPDDLAAALEAAAGSAAVGLRSRMRSMTLAELRAAGADEDQFPTADALIKVFAGLLADSGLMWREKREPPYEDIPLLLMDLKAEAFNAGAINGIAAVAQSVRATPHIALLVSSPHQLELVQQHTQWRGPLIQAFMDRDNPNPIVSSIELQPFALLAPSIRMSDAFMAAAGRLGKPLLTWTVDSPADLHRGLELGVNAVVSNAPLALRSVLMDWRDRCSDRQDNAGATG
ncbi:hypothetical protein COHA_008343 [Chlorella ohadii]|uniref:glycerophosphodiester phosphodiesterase n=1 Tax=Chlorella ohadii TaxID=2649997 RepID=A0AAD5DKH3_9CHLO|nr:hypothetical protein COHA_008343 [Chlorella ohadii]